MTGKELLKLMMSVDLLSAFLHKFTFLSVWLLRSISCCICDRGGLRYWNLLWYWCRDFSGGSLSDRLGWFI